MIDKEKEELEKILEMLKSHDYQSRCLGISLFKHSKFVKSNFKCQLDRLYFHHIDGWVGIQLNIQNLMNVNHVDLFI